MALEKYLKKRKFEKTPEPRGKAGKKKETIFVIQKHNASHLHYDFRLEVGGVLKSWAVPKGIPKKGEKHLAVMVEDHPIEYAKFHGIIPEGNYGAGKVEIWDKGVYESLNGDVDNGLRKGVMEIKLDGKKEKGIFDLINTKFQGKKKNWLLIKR